MSGIKAVFDGTENPAYERFGYSPTLKAGPLIFISGVVATDERGTVFAAAEAEYHAAFAEIGRRLDAAGASFRDVVAIDSFHVADDFPAEVQRFASIKAAYVARPYPTWTAIGVRALGIAGARVEIKVTAWVAGTTDPEETPHAR